MRRGCLSIAMVRLDHVRRLMLTEPSRLECAGLAALGAVLAGLARAAMGGLAASAPFVSFIPFALITATILGWRWGVFYVLCASAVILVFFPSARLVHRGMHWEALPFLLVFVASCALLIAIGDMLRRVFRELATAHREIEQLSRELFHRGQNTITVVEALVRLSARTEGLTVPAYRDGLVDRLHALAKANTLFAAHDQHTDLAELVTLALSPFASGGNLTIAGPVCAVKAAARQSLALVLHELGTNALKYGALLVPGGRVEVRWTIDPEGSHADLAWAESGGPPVTGPSRTGMGSSLLANMRQLHPEIEWHPGGVRCRLIVPIEAVAGEPAAGLKG